MKFRLPPLIRYFRSKFTYLAVWVPYIAVYQAVNRWPLVDPVELPFTALDRAVPFVPELISLYVAYLPFYWWTVARAENDREANRILYATHVQLMLSLPVFILWPVRMPRELFYGPQLYNWADGFWRWFDAPNNCFPSLHVSNCLMLTLFNWHRPYRWPATLAATAVIASTLLVKQHYVVDIAGGAGVFLISLWFLRRLEITGVDEGGWLTRPKADPNSGGLEKATLLDRGERL